MTSPLLIKIAREILKDLLNKCTPVQQNVFKQMYDYNDRYDDIFLIVDNLDTDKLDHAIDQVDRTIQKNNIESLLPENLPF